MGTRNAHLSEMSIVARLSVDVAWWAPLATVPWLDVGLAVHLVDILKREGARLVEEEPDDDGGSEIACCKDVAECE